MSMEALKHSIFGNTPWSLQPKRISALVLAAVAAIIVPSLNAQSYVPPVVTTASTTLFSNGSTSMGPGRVGVDKAGNVFYINHVSPYTLYEIPAASPAVTVTTPVPLITGLGVNNSNAVFVDANGNLWVANGNGSATPAGGSSESIGLVKIPATGGIPNTAALTAGGETLNVVAAVNCTATSTMPCVYQDNTFATNITNYYSQPSDLYVSATGNVYFVDYYDGISSGAYNRIVEFNIATPATGTLLADNLAHNNAAQVAVDGAGKVYYADSSTVSAGSGHVSLVSGGTLTTVGGTATLTTALITSATGVSADSYGNLYIASTTQFSEVPFEGTALNFTDEFGIVSGLTNNVIYGGTVDAYGNYYYASYTNIQQLQINGYNFGSAPVGKLVTSSTTPAAPSLTLYFNAAEASVSSYFITGSPTTLTNTNAAFLQSFPYSGTKSFGGGTSFTAGQTGTITMDFQPIHSGLLKGSFTPRSGGANDAIVNLQGVGVGPQPLFFPGTPSLLFTKGGTVALNAPGGLAVDTYGDIFVADSGNGKVVADCLSTTTANVDGTSGTTANGFCANTTYVGTVTQLGTGFTTPSAIALDGANDLYVTDNAANTVTEISGVSLTSTVLVSATATFGGTALSGPKGIAVDGYTNVYIADTGNNRIVLAHQFGAAATDNIIYIPSTTTFGGTALSGPTGLAVDSAGNLFIADTGNNRIVEYTSLGAASVVSSGSLTLSAPTGITVYPSDSLVVTDAANGVSLINGASSQVLSFGSTYTTTGAKGVALDLAGNIYLSNTSGDQVLELNVTSSPTLTFASTTEGQTSAPTTTQVFNSGNTSLVLSGLAFSNSNYSLDPSSTCTSTSTVTAGISCNLLTDFTPQLIATPGTLTASLTLTDNQDSYTLAAASNEIGTFFSTGTQALNLTGTAVAAITGRAEQTITFPAPASPVLTNVGPITLSATASSGLPITFLVTSGPGTISGNTLTITGAGTIVVAALQPGNATYAPATTISQTIIVNQAPLTAQTITFTVLASSVTYGVAPITLSATASSSLPVTISITSGPATISGNTLTITGAGTVVVAANQAGNLIYAAATVSQSIVVSQASQTITFAALTSPVTYGVAPMTLSATASSGLAVTLAVTSGPATISGSTLTITNAGTVVVAASQTGNTNYAAAPTVSQSIVVNIVGTVATPTFTPATGTYAAGQTVTLADTTPGAAIYYTTDGTTPTTSSTLYKGAITITATPVGSTSASQTIQAVAVATGYINSPAASAVYTIAPQNFSVAVGSGTLTVKDGQSGTITVSVTPSYGYAGPVSFGCSGLPAGATCSFSPSPIIASGTAPVTTTLTIATTTAQATAVLHRNSSPLFPGATLAVGLCLLGFRKRRRLQTLLLVIVGVIGLSMINGCSGDNNSTPSSVSTPTGNSTVTVNVTGGTVVKSTTFTLTVQ